LEKQLGSSAREWISDRLKSILLWFDSSCYETDPISPDADRIDWLRCVPYLAMHVMCLGVIWVGWSWIAAGTAIALYLVRMFFITGFYHRYFSHRTFRTSRFFQFIMAVSGLSAVQRGPLWWAAHHRHHHAHADQEEDVHSPRIHGFWWSHTGWFMTRTNYCTRIRYVRDWAKYPELMFLNRFDLIVPAILATGLYAFGSFLDRFYPGLGTSGMQMLIWGFFISTVALYHGTFVINSLAHVFGRRRYQTRDDSRNNLILTLITLGEGWHNNHHYSPGSCKQGFYWWEIDPTYWILKVMASLHLIHHLNPVPARAVSPTSRSARAGKK
jgi:stearoyl-CoA desaturase (delta-9 desaturase)